jgi:hypothetical protein
MSGNTDILYFQYWSELIGRTIVKITRQKRIEFDDGRILIIDEDETVWNDCGNYLKDGDATS